MRSIRVEQPARARNQDETGDESLRAETTVAPLMEEAGKRLEFFRFPMNHTGDTKPKHDAIAAFLAEHGYKLATCTIENSDYLFNDAYVRFLAQKDKKAAKKLRLEYLAYSFTVERSVFVDRLRPEFLPTSTACHYSLA